MLPMAPDGRFSVSCFMLGISVLLLPLVTGLRHESLTVTGRLAFLVYFVLLNVLLLVLFPNRQARFQVAIRACFLGFVCGCGLILSSSISSWRYFGWYLCSLSFFHYSEYLVTAITNPRNLTLDSFLLNHSSEYKLAAISSWLEFSLESLFFPVLKENQWISILGLFLAVSGEVLRKAAMLTAGSNFTHVVASERASGHVLVTRGVYSVFRHPSYVGWFYWSVGTQAILCNPLCLVGYAIVSWQFFRDRIEDEEITLISFFGDQYLDYKARVYSGLPFIHGY
uniref:protein-S-isoprenylcysteine O-methyltransferase n=1 Tax=Myxine glutinosa TaxID=7769 RepID=UPI0035900A01